MFKLYSAISALNHFSTGYHTEFIDSIDSMQCFAIDQGFVFTCPERNDYWMGNGIALFNAPDDVGGQPLTALWDEHVAPHMPKALKKFVFWESAQFIDYKNFDEKYDLGGEVILKYSSDAAKISRPIFNVKQITRDDFQKMVDIYVAENGESQRGFIEWRTGERMAAIDAGHCCFFAIWNESRNEIAAIAGLYWKDGIYRYASVTTRKGYRGRGYASALIAHIRDYALSHGAKEIYIVADKDSQAAGIYINAGFEISCYEYSILADR